jgi:co-chaperonin GroES (HSP10)
MKRMINMSHQHDLIKDEETNSTLGSHQFPRPMGWKVLVQPSQAKKQTKGGILLPSQSVDNEEYLTADGILLAKGELAYRDRETGQSWKGDWPKVGDHITYGKYAGQKVIVNGVKVLLLNDDEITSVIPEGVNLTSYVN